MIKLFCMVHSLNNVDYIEVNNIKA